MNRQLRASYQALAWYGHTLKYLGGIDPHLAAVFKQAMEAAGYPVVSAAEALEAICADFLAGPHRDIPGAAEGGAGHPGAPGPQFKVLTDDKIAEQEAP